MITYLDTDSISEILTETKNWRSFYRSGYVLIYSVFENIRGIPELYTISPDENIVDLHVQMNYFNMSFSTFIPQEKRNEWKKAILDFSDTGANLPNDIPDYVFIIHNASYEGSVDFSVIYDNYLVML